MGEQTFTRESLRRAVAMGKVKKARRKSAPASQSHPYARPTTDDAMAMDDGEHNGEATVPCPTDRTRGQMLQRHKLEWKSVRKDLKGLKKERVKLSKKNIDEKGARKDMSRQLKSMEEGMKERHAAEIAAWDAHAAAAAAEEAAEDNEIMEEEL